MKGEVLSALYVGVNMSIKNVFSLNIQIDCTYQSRYNKPTV